jgi:hypothetical protein
VMAASSPCRAINAQRGDTLPPCGVPAVVGVHVSASMIPERHHARTCRRMPESAWRVAKSV